MSTKDCQVGSPSCNPIMDRIADLERRLTEAGERVRLERTAAYRDVREVFHEHDSITDGTEGHGGSIETCEFCNTFMSYLPATGASLYERKLAEARIGEHEGSCPFCSTSPTYRHLCVRWAELRRATEPKEPAMPRKLARFQSCGCNLCVCEDEDQCQGCGAIHCGTHPVGQFPNPLYVEEQPNGKA